MRCRFLLAYCLLGAQQWAAAAAAKPINVLYLVVDDLRPE